MTSPQARTYWEVHEPEAGVRVVVSAHTIEEAQAVAWRGWYGRDPASELEVLMRAALSVTATDPPAE